MYIKIKNMYLINRYSCSKPLSEAVASCPGWAQPASATEALMVTEST